MPDPDPDLAEWDAPPQTIAEMRVQKLVDAYAHGRIRCKKDIERLAKACGSGAKVFVVEKLARSDNIKTRIGQEVQFRALAMVAQRLDDINEMAKTKGWAFKALAQIATIIPVGGVSITQNTLVDARISGSTASVQASARQFWERVRAERSGMKLIDVASEPAEIKEGV